MILSKDTSAKLLLLQIFSQKDEQEEIMFQIQTVWFKDSTKVSVYFCYKRDNIIQNLPNDTIHTHYNSKINQMCHVNQDGLM